MKFVFVQLGNQSGDATLNRAGNEYVQRVAHWIKEETMQSYPIFAWPFSGLTLEAAGVIGKELGVDPQSVDNLTSEEARSHKMVVVVVKENKVPTVFDDIAISISNQKCYLPPGDTFVGDCYFLDYTDFPIIHRRLPA